MLLVPALMCVSDITKRALQDSWTASLKVQGLGPSRGYSVSFCTQEAPQLVLLQHLGTFRQKTKAVRRFEVTGFLFIFC